jgi:hypothetical protein
MYTWFDSIKIEQFRTIIYSQWLLENTSQVKQGGRCFILQKMPVEKSHASHFSCQPFYEKWIYSLLVLASTQTPSNTMQ